MSTPSHPIRLVGGHDLQRSRLTVFFRLILVIPHVIVLAVYAIGVFFAEIIAWFAALFTGRVPLSLHDFIGGYLRYSARVLATRFRRSAPAAAIPSMSKSIRR
jgi:hypothetical protein